MTELPLLGKKVIFFCPKTFGYEVEIQRELKSMGAEVTFHSDRPKEHPWVKALIRLLPMFAWYYCDKVFFSWLRKDGPVTCDIIFIVKGEGISAKFLRKLRERYPNTRIILYLWDSVANVVNTELKLPYIDECFSFDPNDCIRYDQFQYRPLFFLDKYLDIGAQCLNGTIFFIGTLNGDRPKVITQILASFEQSEVFDYWLFVRSRIELTLRKIFDLSLRRLRASRLLFKPMSVVTIKSKFDSCTAVLDIEHPNQTGLTMRTFEVIASGKKLITTNKSIMEHEFYDSSLIQVIDREKPSISVDFLKSKSEPLRSEFALKYSLRAWLSEIFGISENNCE